MLAAYRAAPHVDPSYTAAIGNSASDAGDAAIAAQSTAAIGESAISANSLKGMDPASQRDYWKAADDNTRQMWQSTGYPGPPGVHRGFFGAIKHLAGDALNTTAAPLRMTQHLFRAEQGLTKGSESVGPNDQASLTPGAASVQEQQNPNIMTGWTTKFFSPSAWARAWSATNKGEKTFDAKKYSDTQGRYQSQTLTLGAQTVPLFDVAQAASVGEINDYAKGRLNSDPTAVGDLTNALSSNQVLKDAVNELNGAKLSFGRMITPDSLWHRDPGLAAAISGAGDAVFDVAADPLLQAGKANKAIKAVRWGVKSNEDIDRIYGLQQATQQPGLRGALTQALQSGTTGQGQRWLNEVVAGLNSDNPASVVRKFPTTASMLPTLADKGIDSSDKLLQAMKLPVGEATPENVGQWIKDNHVAARILIGDGSAAGKDTILAPHLSWTDQQLANAKDFTSQKIDWAKNVSIPQSGVAPVDIAGKIATVPLNLLGATAKRMTTLIPEGQRFDPNSAKAVTFVQRFADSYLDRGASDKIVSDWINAGYDTAAKRNIYSDMIGQVFNAAGMNNSAEGRQLMGRWLTDTEQMVLRQKYAPEGLDQMTEDGQTVSHGITESQLTNEWSLPSFRALAAASNKTVLGKIVYGVSNNHLANGFNALWKPAQLLRFGFPIRVSLDELTGGLLRNGVWNTVQARLAKPVAQALGDYAKELDPEHVALASQDGNALGIFAATLAQRTKQAVAYGVKPLISKDIYDGVKWGLDNGALSKGLPEEISASHGGSYLSGDPEKKINLLRSGIKSVPVYFAAGDDYRVYERGNDYFNHIWKWRLGDFAQDSMAKIALQGYKDGLAKENIVRNMADYMQSPEWSNYWNRGARSELLRGDRHVGVDATSDEAALDWANVFEQSLDKTLPQEGMVRDNFVSHMLENQSSPDLDVLDAIDGDLRPQELTGPEQVPIATGGMGAWLKNFSDHGFRYIGKSIDWMARQPLYLHSFAAAHKELRPLIEASIGKGPATEQILKELVEDRAIRNTAPFIHNPEIRSQMNDLARNFLPFEFAQEQFYKRWTRTFVHSPEALRKAQLAYQGITTTGVTHDDGAGNQVFTYPATGMFQKAIGDVFGALGANVLMPIHGGFSGQLKMVAPGLDRTFAPSFGPLVTLPVSQITRFFPELKPAEESLIGPIASSRSAWEQIAPATLARVIHFGIDQETTSASYGSAMMKTIQDITASKIANKDPQAYQDFIDSLNQDPHAKQDFLDAVKNGTRINVALRALLGFGAPAAPQMAIGSTEFGTKMRQLQAMGLDFNAALQELIKSEPSLTPYATFQSAAAGSEPLPSTKEALDALTKDQKFYINNPAAGGFFLPDGPSTSEFSSEAYRLQMTYEMRKRKTPEQFLDQLLYNQAANIYFANRDNYNASTKNVRGLAKSSAANQWAQWKDQFLQDHPVFQTMLLGQESKNKRRDTITALKQAFDDKGLPKGSRTDAIGKLLGTYMGYQRQMLALKGRTDGQATNTRKALTSTMTNFAHGFVVENPEAKSMYQSLIKPDLEGVD